MPASGPKPTTNSRTSTAARSAGEEPSGIWHLAQADGGNETLRDIVPSLHSACGRGQALHHLVDAEAGWLLARWEILEALQPFRHEGLGRPQQKHPFHAPLLVADAP